MTDAATSSAQRHPATPSRQELWESRFQALLKAAADGVVVIDHEGTIELVNEATCDLFGYTSEELTGKNVSLLMPEPEAGQHTGYLKRYLAEGDPRVIGIGREVTARKRDGTLFPMRLAVGEAQHGDRPYFIGLVRNISAERQLEASLRRREHELTRILDASAVATALVDSAGRFIHVNAACSRLYGKGEDELMESDIFAYCVEEDRQRLAAMLASLGQPSTDATSCEHRILGPSGERLVETHAALLNEDREEGGEQGPIVVQTVDHTERLHAEQRARETLSRLAHSNRLGTLGEMAAGIAHELNQPLGAIVNYAQAGRNILGQSELDPERLRMLCERIAAQAERAGEVIRRLRHLTRGEVAEPTLVDLREVIADAVRLAETEARLEGQRVRLRLPNEVARAYVDPVQIQQVVINLIHNALDATRDVTPKSRHQVHLTLARENDYWAVAVRDLGPGLTEEQQRLLLTPFYTTKKTGTGLGLVICQSILTAHDGRLEFANAPEGRGAVFTFRLPIDMPAEGEALRRTT